jgi:hypothetical protein
MFKKHIKTAKNYSVVGTFSAIALASIYGCEQKQGNFDEQTTNQFFVIQKKVDGSFEVIEQHPTTGPTRAILRDVDGKERFLSEEEIKQIALEEKAKIENGQSNLTRENRGGGMSLGETIMAAAGGALLGSLIGNALANKLNKNSNFQNRQNTARRTSGFSRSASGVSKKSTSANSKRGFFGSKGASSNRGSFGGRSGSRRSFGG